MKIMISSDNAFAHLYIRLGLAQALNACGHEVVLWDINKKPPTDAFDVFEPDIFIGQTYNINKSLIKMIKERPNLKVIMKAADWGESEKDINREEYPILFAAEKEKRVIVDLFWETGQPNFLKIHYHPDYIDYTHGYWKKEGIPVYSELSAANIFEFTNGQKLDEFACDIAFVGGYWGYKSRVINDYLFPIINNNNIHTKIFGNQPWPTVKYCGFIRDEYVKHAFASANICPNLHEPHSQKFGFDIVERPYKLLSNKCFVISDYVEGLYKLLPNAMVFAKNKDDFQEKILHYLKYPDEKQKFIENGYKEVLSRHTYFHRAASMFERLNMDNEAQKCYLVYQQILRNLHL